MRGLRAAVAATLVLGLGVAVQADAAPALCTERRPGGEWARYGQDLMGQQRQLAEKTINRENVAQLAPVWTIPQTGYQSAPPIVSGGCVFINQGGRIVAYDLDDGHIVWESTGADTTGTFAVAVENGRVHVALGGGRPRAAAFDVRTGKLLWVSQEIWFGQDANQLASAVVFNGMQILFTTGPDFEPAARQGYGIIDAKTGRVLFKTTTLTAAELAEGYNGGGVWGTPTVDPKTGYLYAGTSNPESKTKEHEYDNAILKIDLNRSHKTFGRVVASYKGTADSVTGYDNPVCQNLGGTVWYNQGNYGSAPLCGQLDMDFGNGPTLWRDAKGRVLGAATQKSMVFHVFDATTMAPVWTNQTFTSLSFLSGNIGRAATDGKTLWVPTTPGRLFAFDAATGAEKWHTGAGAPTGGNAALANGVVYWTGDTAVRAYHPETGAVLWESPSTPNQDSFGSIAGSVAIAGNTVIANHSGTIEAYRIGGTGGSGPVPDLPEVPPLGAQMRVMAGPGATNAGYLTPTVIVPSGLAAQFINADAAPHDVISRDRGKDGRPLFRSELINLGATSPIEGVTRLQPGTYEFFCSLHSAMTGSLIVP